jgi:hypothetical protein
MNVGSAVESQRPDWEVLCDVRQGRVPHSQGPRVGDLTSLEPPTKVAEIQSRMRGQLPRNSSAATSATFLRRYAINRPFPIVRETSPSISQHHLFTRLQDFTVTKE